MSPFPTTDLELSLLGLGLTLVFGYFAVDAWLLSQTPDRLRVAVASPASGDVDVLNGQVRPGRVFYLAVRNLDRRRVARDCYAYLLSLRWEGSDRELVRQTTELKWRGFPIHPNAAVLPRSQRIFDAFWVAKAEPDRLLLNAFLDSGELVPDVKGSGRLRAVYLIIAENFKASRRSFLIRLDPELQSVSIRES